MNITVIGPGRWGSFITWYLNDIGHNVTLYGRDTSASMTSIINNRSNGLVNFSEKIALTTDLSKAVANDYIVISVNSQGLRPLLQQMKSIGVKGKTIVLCMKGIEIETGMRLTEVVHSVLDNSCKVAVWIGPGHVQEFLNRVPNLMVIDSDDEGTKRKLVDEFSSDLIRFYYGRDLIGNEIGAAAKNVTGIAAGMLDGTGLSSLKGALMTRGTREIARLIKAAGGNELSAYGLCHLGDFEATVFSKYSHNRSFGEAFVKGEKYTALAEGYYTVKALMFMKIKYNVDLPICTAVYEVLYLNKAPSEVMKQLFLRSLKEEF